MRNFQDWVLDAFQGQAGDTDPYAGSTTAHFVQTMDVVNTKAGTQGKDDFWMKMFDGFGEDDLEGESKSHGHRRRALRCATHSAARPDQQQLPPSFHPVHQDIKNVLDRVQPRIGFSWSPYSGTVVRGGYGLFSALNQGSTYYAMRVENGVVQINYNYTGC